MERLFFLGRGQSWPRGRLGLFARFEYRSMFCWQWFETAGSIVPTTAWGRVQHPRSVGPGLCRWGV